METDFEDRTSTGIIDCPAELLDEIAQLLPRASFLSLRATCKNLQQKTDYHFKKRHLPEKKVILANDYHAGLASLVEFAGHPHFARHTRKICVEVGIDTLFQADWIFKKPIRALGGQWTDYFNTSPYLPIMEERAVDIGLLFTSLGKLPALEALEFTQYTHSSTTAPRSGHRQLLDAD
ncbi:uncharacterized protein BDZ99DRAFT_471978 [Mytilinidion resinicola]|uniref:F-box domain-containing protein n=1 Tax=Mytilinidion resinicola TaxID=574789 RepID=A0A6A6Z2V6_9PEZI|nr:uncharacterized protein BDZ99DRAFT_471978 [Mytilinidion resinicola]KAF2814567.1 hypothetical protein BDZ99DRAFT_471978 [Mytilinidion resinicola]